MCTWDAQLVASARCCKPAALSAFAAVLINICSLISVELHAEKQSMLSAASTGAQAQINKSRVGSKRPFQGKAMGFSLHTHAEKESVLFNKLPLPAWRFK